MQFSHSRVECFKQCPHKFMLRYLKGLTTLPDQEASNALYCGTAMHTGVEEGVQAGRKNYYDNYYMLDDLQINEGIKIEAFVPKVRKLIGVDDGDNEVEFEVEINTPDFKGFIDCMVPAGKRKWKLYDFKYSNHTERYLLSDQLHLYKYFYERTHPLDEIVEIGFIMIPKT